MNFDFPTILVLACAITGGIWLVDALVYAPRRRNALQNAGADAGNGVDTSEAADSEQAREPLIVEYARSFFPVILVVLVLRSFLVEPFRIPSGSMMPTLLVGDFILVNKFSYGIRLPVINKKIIEIDLPKTGDVVVFRFPPNPKIDYIKRVIGVPGDTVDYVDKVVYINGQPQARSPIGMYTGIGSGARETGTIELKEQLGGVAHSILNHPYAPNLTPGCNLLRNGPVTVPEGHYLVMGDNRDNSNDGRCWGFVPEENLVGKAFAIWMSWDSERDGSPVAFDRLGNGIE